MVKKFKKLTAKKADEIVYEVWDWVYHHPSKSKRDWPEWERDGGSIPDMLFACAYCEFYRVSADHFDGCVNCPLYKAGHPCEQCADPKDDYYTCWLNAATPRTKKKYAKLIRDIAGKRLGK